MPSGGDGFVLVREGPLRLPVFNIEENRIFPRGYGKTGSPLKVSRDVIFAGHPVLSKHDGPDVSSNGNPGLVSKLDQKIAFGEEVIGKKGLDVPEDDEEILPDPVMDLNQTPRAVIRRKQGNGLERDRGGSLCHGHARRLILRKEYRGSEEKE